MGAARDRGVDKLVVGQGNMIITPVTMKTLILPANSLILYSFHDGSPDSGDETRRSVQAVPCPLGGFAQSYKNENIKRGSLNILVLQTENQIGVNGRVWFRSGREYQI